MEFILPLFIDSNNINANINVNLYINVNIFDDLGVKSCINVSIFGCKLHTFLKQAQIIFPKQTNAVIMRV